MAFVEGDISEVSSKSAVDSAIEDLVHAADPEGIIPGIDKLVNRVQGANITSAEKWAETIGEVTEIGRLQSAYYSISKRERR